MYDANGDWIFTGSKTLKTDVTEFGWNAPHSGEYFLVAFSGSYRTETGEYSITLSVSEDIVDDHGDSRDDATHFEAGEAVQGVLGYGKDADFLSFTAIGETTYEINVTSDSGPSLRFDVYDRQGSRLGSNINRLGEPVILWLPYGERQYPVFIGIGQHANDRRSSLGYSLSVSHSEFSDDHANIRKYATTISTGDRIEASIDFAGDVDTFRLRGENGESYQFEVTAESSGLGIGVGAFDSQKDAYVGGRSVVIDSFDRKSPHLTVSSIRNEVGSYTLVVSPSNVIDDHGGLAETATPISPGTTVAGRIDHAHDWDIFCFPAVQGVTYEVELGMGSLKYARLGIYDSSNRSHSNFAAGQRSESPLRLELMAISSERYCVHIDVYEPGPARYDPDSIGDYTVTVRAQ